MFNLQLINNLSSVLSKTLPLERIQVNLSTDSRTVQKGDLFVALVGEKFDATDFVNQILDKKPAAVVYQDSPKARDLLISWKLKASDICFIAVTSGEQFLAELSAKRMSEWKEQGGLVIGITGSNGKTTHKEMLTHLLNALFPGMVHATRGNLNNHLGVPFTILQLEEAHKIAIVEMGTNHPGEIPPLCAMAQPDAGIITNIGDSHLEFFKNREGVFADKRALYDAIAKTTSPKKTFVHIASDPLLASLPRAAWVVSFGREQADQLVEYSAGHLHWKSFKVQNPHLLGEHNYSNLACCLILADRLFSRTEELVAAAKSFMPRANRSQLVTIGEQKFYMDAYNANPSSMIAGVQAVIQANVFDLEQTLFILGDMNELGDTAPALHQQVGEVCRQLGIRHILFVGRYRQFYLKGWGTEAILFESTQALLAKWPEIRPQFRNFFIKGSRTLQLESLTAIT